VYRDFIDSYIVLNLLDPATENWTI